MPIIPGIDDVLDPKSTIKKTFMTLEDTNNGAVDIYRASVPIKMYVTNDDQKVTMWSYKDGKTNNFQYTFKKGENFEIVGRNQSNPDELLIKHKDYYGYIVVPGVSTAVINGDSASNTFTNRYENIAFDPNPNANYAVMFNNFMLEADNAKNVRQSSVDNITTIDTSPQYTENDIIVADFPNEIVVTPGTYQLDSAKESALDSILGSYGIPPQWTKYVDPRVYSFALGSTAADAADGGRSNIIAGLGRRYVSVIISNPTVIELAPGYIKYSSWLQGALTDMDVADELSGDEITGLTEMFDQHDSKFYTIKPCFSGNPTISEKVTRPGYIKYVNVLLYIAAIFLSRANSDNSEGTIDLFDSGGVMQQIPVALSKRSVPKVDGGIYTDINWEFFDKASGYINIGGLKIGTAGADQGGSDRFDYIKFYLSGSTTANDQFDTQTDESMLSNLANAINSGIKEFAYWADSKVGDVITSIASGIDDILGGTKLNGEAPLAGIFNASEMVAGAKVVFPKIITESSYGKSIQCECTFVGLYGEEEALYLNTLRPYLHLLAFVLPHQVKSSLEMYTFPFLVKAFCRGLFNVEMGVITGFNVTRGGNDNALWSFNGSAELISVSFEVTPLITNLVMTSETDGLKWLLRNKGLHEYMSAITAYDARNDKYDLGVDIATAWKGRSVKAKAKAIAENIVNGDLGLIIQNLIATGTQAGGVEGMAGDVSNIIRSNIEGLLSF